MMLKVETEGTGTFRRAPKSSNKVPKGSIPLIKKAIYTRIINRHPLFSRHTLLSFFSHFLCTQTMSFEVCVKAAAGDPEILGDCNLSLKSFFLWVVTMICV